VDQPAFPEFTFNMNGLSQTPPITPDAPFSDPSDLSALYQSVAADIPESQRQRRDSRSLQVSAYLCFEEKIEPFLTC
jgi:hypothetical protein